MGYAMGGAYRKYGKIRNRFVHTFSQKHGRKELLGFLSMSTHGNFRRDEANRTYH